MRITFVTPPLGLGGGTRVVVIYAQHLMRMGHAVRIVAPPPARVPLKQKVKAWLNGDVRLGNSSESYIDGSGVDHHILGRPRAVIDADVPDADVVIATWWQSAEWVNALSPSKGTKVYFIQHHEIFPLMPVERVKAT